MIKTVSAQNEVEAVVAQEPDSLEQRYVERLQAVQRFAALPEAAALASSE